VVTAFGLPDFEFKVDVLRGVPGLAVYHRSNWDSQELILNVKSYSFWLLSILVKKLYLHDRGVLFHKGPL
jgi:hypothetical protein